MKSKSEKKPLIKPRDKVIEPLNNQDTLLFKITHPQSIFARVLGIPMSTTTTTKDSEPPAPSQSGLTR